MHVLNFSQTFVVCIIIGAITRVNAYFGRGSGPIWLDDLGCTGSEISLLDCPHGGIGVYASNCGHDDDVGVECPTGECISC